MTYSSSMQAHSILQSRNRDPRIKSAAVAPTYSFPSDEIASKSSFNPPVIDASLHCPDLIEKAAHPIDTVDLFGSQSVGKRFMMSITIDANSVTKLRHLVFDACGELVAFMRMQPVAHNTKMKVWLCLSQPVVDLIMDMVMRSLSCAEFGRITLLEQHVDHFPERQKR